MVDTNDQNQVGPPLVVSTPTITATAPHPPSGEGVSTEHLEAVSTLVDTFTDLVSVVREVDDRTRMLERDRRETRGEQESPEIKRIWVSAIEPLAQYLSQSIQLAPGAKPVQLADAAEQFGAWVATFKENAVGPGGQGLQHDARRLTAFEAKLHGVDPSPAWIEQEGQRLLIRPELDPATVHRTIAATIHSLTEEHERTAAIDQTLASLDQEWEASIPLLEDQLRERRDELQLLLSTPSSSEHLKTLAGAGLKAVTAITTDVLVATRVSVGEWIEKYRTDQSFTSEQVRQRINQEIRPAIRQLQSKVEEIERTWNVAALQNKERETHKLAEQERLGTLDAVIDKVRTRYTALVNLRRTKLGQEPDERFFGEIARLVNSAITDLGNLEADLLAAQTRLKEQTLNATDDTIKQLQIRVEYILKQSNDYANQEQMERRLTAHAKAIQREQERAEARERQLAKEQAQQTQREQQEAERRKRQEEREAKSEARRQQYLVRQLQTNEHVKAAQEQLEQQQSFDQELRTYVTELTEANQARQRHADSITSLITSERQSLDEDRRQFLEGKAERRAMTASEATAWLAQLAERERLLNERQDRLNQLTQELQAFQATTSDDRRLNHLRERLASLSTTTTVPPIKAAPDTRPTANTNEPVRIAIGRRQ